jgi:hypothetical protein
MTSTTIFGVSVATLAVVGLTVSGFTADPPAASEIKGPILAHLNDVYEGTGNRPEVVRWTTEAQEIDRDTVFYTNQGRTQIKVPAGTKTAVLKWRVKGPFGWVVSHERFLVRGNKVVGQITVPAEWYVLYHGESFGTAELAEPLDFQDWDRRIAEKQKANEPIKQARTRRPRQTGAR